MSNPPEGFTLRKRFRVTRARGFFDASASLSQSGASASGRSLVLSSSPDTSFLVGGTRAADVAVWIRAPMGHAIRPLVSERPLHRLLCQSPRGSTGARCFTHSVFSRKKGKGNNDLHGKQLQGIVQVGQRNADSACGPLSTRHLVVICSMTETHPYRAFVPLAATRLILGSFPGKSLLGKFPCPGHPSHWFYGAVRNQFWPILESAYGISLTTVSQRKAILFRLNIAMADIIIRCDRIKNSNLDSNLRNLVYNFRELEEIFSKNSIRTVYFTSCFVERRFRSHFRHLLGEHSLASLVTLPSPSPRYASLSMAEKVIRYRELLPPLIIAVEKCN